MLSFNEALLPTRETALNEYQAVAFTIENSDMSEILPRWYQKAYPEFHFKFLDKNSPRRTWYAGYLTKYDTNQILGNYQAYYDKAALPMGSRHLNQLTKILNTLDRETLAVQLALTLTPEYYDSNHKIKVEEELNLIAKTISEVIKNA